MIRGLLLGMWWTLSQSGRLLVAAALTVACGKVHQHGETPSAASGGTAGSAAGGAPSGGAGGGGASGASGAAGAPAMRCQLPLAGRCGELEAASPRVLTLAPDEYRNSLRTLFGVDVDVAALLGTGPFERLTSVLSPDIVAAAAPAYSAAAKLAAASIAEQTAQLLLCADDACVAKFIADTAPKVWRSAVLPADQAELAGAFQQASGDVAAKFEALVLALLDSPRFYFRTELGDTTMTTLPVRALTGDELAAKLSYRLWADTPDDALL